MDDGETPEGRVYGGRSLQQRREDRRARLLGAGFELFGTEGWNGTTIERICGVAGVATRSFYEEFQSREALLEAVYLQVMEEARELVVAALAPATTSDEAGSDGDGSAGDGSGDGAVDEQDLLDLARGTMRSYLTFMTEDPRRAQIAHREIRFCGALDRSRQGVNGRFVAIMLRERGLQALPAPLRRLVATALAGATSEVLVDWVSLPGHRLDTDTMVDALSHLYVTVLTGLVAAPPLGLQE